MLEIMIIGDDFLRLTPEIKIKIKKSNYSLNLNTTLEAKILIIS